MKQGCVQKAFSILTCSSHSCIYRYTTWSPLQQINNIYVCLCVAVGRQMQQEGVMPCHTSRHTWGLPQTSLSLPGSSSQGVCASFIFADLHIFTFFCMYVWFSNLLSYILNVTCSLNLYTFNIMNQASNFLFSSSKFIMINLNKCININPLLSTFS